MAPDSLSGGLETLRYDLRLIADMITPDSRVLDIGCGDGDLLAYLEAEKSVDARGIELSQNGVNACVARGLSVIQGDADTDLDDYPNGAFDFVVLSRTLQATRRPEQILANLVRIGKHAVVSFVNYGHWRKRLTLLVSGRIPVNQQNSFWYDSPDIHPCTILDFVSMCRSLGLTVESTISVERNGASKTLRTDGHSANLLGEQAIFRLSRQ